MRQVGDAICSYASTTALGGPRPRRDGVTESPSRSAAPRLSEVNGCWHRNATNTGPRGPLRRGRLRLPAVRYASPRAYPSTGSRVEQVPKLTSRCVLHTGPGRTVESALGRDAGTNPSNSVTTPPSTPSSHGPSGESQTDRLLLRPSSEDPVRVAAIDPRTLPRMGPGSVMALRGSSNLTGQCAVHG
jgi:hypothetical protein